MTIVQKDSNSRFPVDSDSYFVANQKTSEELIRPLLDRMRYMYGKRYQMSPSSATTNIMPLTIDGTVAGPNGYAPYIDASTNIARFAVWALKNDETMQLRAILRDDAVAVADLCTATDLLARYLKHERIAGVVRRPIPSRGRTTLLDLLMSGKTDEVLKVCQEMFRFDDVHT